MKGEDSTDSLEDRKDPRGNIIIVAGTEAHDKGPLRTRLDMEVVVPLIKRTLAAGIN
jgi:hypothetical protein